MKRLCNKIVPLLIIVLAFTTMICEAKIRPVNIDLSETGWGFSGICYLDQIDVNGSIAGANDETIANSTDGEWTFGGAEMTSMLTEVVNVTTNTTILLLDSGFMITNEGAAAAITLTLPTAAAGLTYTISDVEVTAGYDLTIQAASGDTINGGTAGKKYACTTDSVKQTVTLVAIDATQWIVRFEVGTWANDNS